MRPETNKTSVNVAIVGATGLVGIEMRQVLEHPSRHAPYRLALFASQARPDEGVMGLEESLPALKACRYVLNAASSEVAVFLREHLVEGQFLIDNSSAFRLEPDVALIVPEINGALLASRPPVVANPNCTAILICMALNKLRELGLARVVASTYQAASGAGIKGLEALDAQIAAMGKGLEMPVSDVFPFQLAGNVMSHNTAIREEGNIGAGYNDEEWKVIEETRKILDIRHLAISATCVRVPVRRAHTVALTIDFKTEVAIEQVRELLAHAPGLKIVDDWQSNHFPMPIEAENGDLVLVGRVRRDPSLAKTVHLMLSGDQLRKGAALNAIQIMDAFEQVSHAGSPA